MTPQGPADKAGLKVGDKLLEINGKSMADQRHEIAVKCMQENMSAVELVIQRGLLNVMPQKVCLFLNSYANPNFRSQTICRKF